MNTIGFIGAGTTGTALAVQLTKAGYNVTAVASRTRQSAEKLAARIDNCIVYDRPQEVADKTELVFITTPDDAIATVAAQVQWHEGQSVVHCSGAHSTDILEPAAVSGAQTGCIHPLQTFASADQAINNLPGSTFAIEAGRELQKILQKIAVSLEGSFVVLTAEDKVRYHAAAVFACNYLVTLVELATNLWKGFEISQQHSVKSLMPLLRGTLSNIENIGLPDCLTGPIARGDMGTINKHLEVLKKEKEPALLQSYKLLGRQTVPIALAKGKINLTQAEELYKLLQ